MAVLLTLLLDMQMRSTLLPGQPWDVMVDLFFYREPEETKDPSEEEAADYGGDAQPYGQLPAPGGQSIPWSLFLSCWAMLKMLNGVACAFALNVHQW